MDTLTDEQLAALTELERGIWGYCQEAGDLSGYGLEDFEPIFSALADARLEIADFKSQYYIGTREGCNHLKRLTVGTEVEECVGCEYERLEAEVARLRAGGKR